MTPVHAPSSVGESDDHLHSVSAGGVVLDPAWGRVLVIRRRDTGAWATPGGIVEAGEDPRQAVAREVQEETGLVVVPEKLTGVYKNMATGVVSVVFRCRPATGEIAAAGETMSVRWMSIRKALRELHRHYAERVRDATGEGGPVLRSYAATIAPRHRRTSLRRVSVNVAVVDSNGTPVGTAVGFMRVEESPEDAARRMAAAVASVRGPCSFLGLVDQRDGGTGLSLALRMRSA